MATANDEQNALPQTNRQTWLIVFAAMTGAVLLYGLMCFFMAQGRAVNPQSALKPPVDVLRWILTAMAVVSLLASIVWMYVKTNGKIGYASTYGVAKAELLSPGEFQK